MIAPLALVSFDFELKTRKQYQGFNTKEAD